MKKIDKLILSSFLGPFILTFTVVLFILLMVNMVKYFDDLIGKDLGWDVLATLWLYFAVMTTPIAMPLAVLLSSLITFGNLGEHFELTAVKSLGISLVRSLAPIFLFVIFFTFVAYYINNYLVPKAALEAYSLLYDIKQKKPALDLREGVFYSAIPDINIKVDKKFPDGTTLKDIIIYDHRNNVGNKKMTVADSGKMYSILNSQYLELELFNGYNYDEQGSDPDVSVPNGRNTMSRTKFSKTKVVFDLSSFGLIRTNKQFFQTNRLMRNMGQLEVDMDSMQSEVNTQHIGRYQTSQSQLFQYHFKKDTFQLPQSLKQFQARQDSIRKVKTRISDSIAKLTAPTPVAVEQPATPPVIGQNVKKEFHYDSAALAKLNRFSDSLFRAPPSPVEITNALSQARVIRSQMDNFATRTSSYIDEYKAYEIQWHLILANSFACIAMFLIGAPLGSIIKKGGLGVPVLASILFFILFYVIRMMGEKWAKQGVMSVPLGIWTANIVLLVIGLIFLRQARLDARLFDYDSYQVAWYKLKKWLEAKHLLKPKVA